jgi:hypothetical protein
MAAQREYAASRDLAAGAAGKTHRLFPAVWRMSRFDLRAAADVARRAPRGPPKAERRR